MGVFIYLDFSSFKLEENKMKVEMYVVCASQSYTSVVTDPLLERICSESFCSYFWF